MTTCDPCSDWSDPVPQKETRREFWLRMLDEGRQQSRLTAYAYAIQRFRERYGQAPKPRDRRAA